MRPARRKRVSTVEHEYSYRDAAALLGLSTRSVKRLVASGAIGAKTVYSARCVRIPEGALRAYQLSRRVESSQCV